MHLLLLPLFLHGENVMRLPEDIINYRQIYNNQYSYLEIFKRNKKAIQK